MGNAARMSGQWRPLPTSLDPEIAHLVGLLRELKDRCGLSLAALAAKTAYSKSSWERYLNGATLPPRHAVEALARLAGEPVERLLALWERAEARWSGRAAQAPPTATAPEPAVADRGPDLARPRLRAWVFAVLAACAAVSVLAVLARALGILGVSTPPDSSASTTPPDSTVGCHGAQCAGRDPNHMICGSDGASFADLWIGETYLELRISEQCGAAWGRISHFTIGDQVQVVDQDGRTESATTAEAGSTASYVFTRMIAADQHSHVRACLQPRNGERQCTPWGADHRIPPPTRPLAPSISPARVSP